MDFDPNEFDISEAEALLSSISDDLQCFETAETGEDAKANIVNALALAKRLVSELESLQGQIQ